MINKVNKEPVTDSIVTDTKVTSTKITNTRIIDEIQIHTIVWSEYMEEQEEQAVMEMFSIPRELAREAISKVGKNIKRIKKYLNKPQKSAGRCMLCGKKLTDAESVRRGFGSECYKKILQAQVGLIDLGG